MTRMSDYWYPTNLITLAEMPVTRKKCVNDEQFTYTGKEASPMGLGHTAHKYVVGDRMKGRDNTMWMVAKKNDVNVWVRVPTDSDALVKETPIIPVVAEVLDTEPDDTPVAPTKKTKKTVAKKAPSPPVIEEEPSVEVVEETPVKAEPKAKAKAEPKAKAKAKAEPKAKAVPKAVPKEAKAEAEPEAVPKEKAADEGEKKPKKVSEYNLFVKVQTELAKVDPATKGMDGKARFKYVSQRASELWKTMDAAAKTAAVAGVK